MSVLINKLNKVQNFSLIFSEKFLKGKIVIFDLSSKDSIFYNKPSHEWISLSKGLMEKNSATLAIGRYQEKRFIYESHKQFTSRSIHLGIDLTLPVGAELYAPLLSTVHSFQDNAAEGDYGPTIILSHELEGKIFYTLYGHLSRASLKKIYIGQVIQAGECFAFIGDITENGGWPPHCHFQIIDDLQGKTGDYPGVCSEIDREFYLNNCPDPNLILRIL